MLLIGKIASLWDEESWNSDSSTTNRDLFKIDTAAHVRGRLGEGDPADYYLIDPDSGNFKIFVTTEGLNSSPVTRASFKIEIVGELDQSRTSEHVISPDILTEQIAMKIGPDEGKYYLKITGSRDFNYIASMYPANVGPPLVVADDLDTGQRREDWRLVTTDGFSGSIGGAFGQVFGTHGFQAISVIDIPGRVQFDPSFNRGGDLITLGGDAAEWSGGYIGTSASMHNAQSGVTIPAGRNGLILDFDDGSRLLAIEDYERSSSIMIGDISLMDDVPQFIDTPAQDLDVPGNHDPDAIARLLVQSGGVVVAQGNLEIFGTAGGEEITLRPSAATLDPSFNRGGDALLLEGDFSEFEASVIGSSVLLESDGYAVEIPVGTAGMELIFSDMAATLFYDLQAGSVFIRDQAIGEVAAFLSIG